MQNRTEHEKESRAMKAIIELSLPIVCLTYLAGCAGSAMPGAPTSATQPALAESSCPPTGTFVQFNKMMNGAFSADYQGCNVTTKAKFLMTGGGATFGAEQDRVVITVSAPDEAFPHSVTLPKQGSELAFQLKQGDMIVLRGGTYIPQVGGLLPGQSGALTSVPVFVANSIERSR